MKIFLKNGSGFFRRKMKTIDFWNPFELFWLLMQLRKAWGFEPLPAHRTVPCIVRTKPIQNEHKSLQKQTLIKIRETAI